MEFSLVHPSFLRVASVNVEVKRASAVSEKSSVCQMTKGTGILTENFFRARKALRAHQLWFSSLGGGLVGRWSVAVEWSLFSSVGSTRQHMREACEMRDAQMAPCVER